MIVVFNWPMQTMMGGHFLTKGHDGTLVDKFRAKVSNVAIALRCSASAKPGVAGSSTMCYLAVQLGTQCNFVGCARPTKMGGTAVAIVHDLHHGGVLDTRLVHFLRI